MHLRGRERGVPLLARFCRGVAYALLELLCLVLLVPLVVVGAVLVSLFSLTD